MILEFVVSSILIKSYDLYNVLKNKHRNFVFIYFVYFRCFYIINYIYLFQMRELLDMSIRYQNCKP